jgi:hypothetical protein
VWLLSRSSHQCRSLHTYVNLSHALLLRLSKLSIGAFEIFSYAVCKSKCRSWMFWLAFCRKPTDLIRCWAFCLKANRPSPISAHLCQNSRLEQYSFARLLGDLQQHTFKRACNIEDAFYLSLNLVKNLDYTL